MPAAYWMAHITVTNPERYKIYSDLATAAIAAYGGEFMCRSGRFVQLEGVERPRNVLSRFPSLEAAVECYHSPAYQEALEFAKDSSIRDIVVVEALE